MNEGPNPLSIASVVAGVFAVLASCCGISCGGAIPEFLFAVLGLVLGVLALTQPRAEDAPPDNLAKVGIGLSVAGALLWFVVFLGSMVLGFGANIMAAILGNM